MPQNISHLQSAVPQPSSEQKPSRPALSTFGRWLDTLSGRLRGERSAPSGHELATRRPSAPVTRPSRPQSTQATPFNSAQSAEASRQAALEVLKNVLHIMPRNRVPLPALSACQQEARNLSYALARCPWSEMPTVTRDLALGRHPYSDLLLLAERGDELSDEQWAVLTKKVSSVFERPLAFAAARGKLTFVGQRTPTPEYGTRAAEAQAGEFVFHNIVVP